MYIREKSCCERFAERILNHEYCDYFCRGSGVRMGAGIPKQFLEINGKPIIVHTLQLFQNHDMIDKIYISVLEKYIPYMDDLCKEFRLNKVCGIVAGGETGQDSIYNALKKAESENPVIPSC